MISSTCASSSVFSVQSPAFTLASICSGLVAPAITLATALLRYQPAECQLKQRMAAFLRESLQMFNLLQIGFCVVAIGKVLLFAQTRAFGSSLTFFVFARQQAAGQRKVGKLAHAELFDQR